MSIPASKVFLFTLFSMGCIGTAYFGYWMANPRTIGERLKRAGKKFLDLDLTKEMIEPNWSQQSHGEWWNVYNNRLRMPDNFSHKKYKDDDSKYEFVRSHVETCKLLRDYSVSRDDFEEKLKWALNWCTKGTNYTKAIITNNTKTVET